MNSTAHILLIKRLSFLVRADLPLGESLELLATQSSKKHAALLRAARTRVERGELLSDALENFCTPFARNIIRIGEESGTLAENMAYLAEALHAGKQLRRKIIGALLYPLCIVVATIALVIGLILFLFPKLIPIFTSVHADLPLVTKLLISSSEWLQAWGVVMLLLLIIAGICIPIAYKKVLRIRIYSDRALLYIPLVGSLVSIYTLSTLSRTIALLLRANSTLVDTLGLTARTCEQHTYQEALFNIQAEVTRGESLAHALRNFPKLFPSTYTHLIAIAETTGSLEETAQYLATLYAEELDEKTKLLSSALEPALMILMGGLVALIAVSVILPIYSLTQHLSSS